MFAVTDKERTLRRMHPMAGQRGIFSPMTIQFGAYGAYSHAVSLGSTGEETVSFYTLRMRVTAPPDSLPYTLCLPTFTPEVNISSSLETVEFALTL